MSWERENRTRDHEKMWQLHRLLFRNFDDFGGRGNLTQDHG